MRSASMFVAERTREARRRTVRFAVGRLLVSEGLLPLFLASVADATLFSAAQVSKQWASTACLESPPRLEALEAALLATLTEKTTEIWQACKCVSFDVESEITEQSFPLAVP